RIFVSPHQMSVVFKPMHTGPKITQIFTICSCTKRDNIQEEAWRKLCIRSLVLLCLSTQF
ncbi:hypothetical protein, partial [Salmonella sp. gx-f7]|uniref:hypothetical protein n=1 Tax=Salmonella sp. gx-f7 TaxID=2582606 RepID=UPI001F2FDA61